ncbi:WD40 repeat-like protein [Peniophora sp. CONT]|nr:WD40 repeat-like protein [Peniophora sp. CONT]
MSGLKNSPFGKRVRATQQDEDDRDSRPRTRPRINAMFTGPSTPSSDDSMNTNMYRQSVAGPSIVKEYGDRFVPARDAGDLRTSYNLMEETGHHAPSKAKLIPTESDAVKEQANNLFNSILHTEVAPASPTRTRPSSPARPSQAIAGPSTPNRMRLFAYASPGGSDPTTPSRRLDTPIDQAYSLSPVRASSRALLESPRRQLRAVCKTPYRVLDAPDLADDFYLNLVDWSSTNVLAVGLGAQVYLWTAHTAAVSRLCDLAPDTISSVSWVQKGSQLAIGTIAGRLHIYDAAQLSMVRTFKKAHAQRIGALGWMGPVLASGSRDRLIHFRDVREKTVKPFKHSAAHRQEVCGLRWNETTGLLASGGNDNKVCIWDLRGSRRSRAASRGQPPAVPPAASGEEDDTPLWKFHEHNAAVKALAWDPHVSDVLASGGGTQDKHIRFWNVQFGSCIGALDTGSQVCNLTWSLTSHELVSTHGFSSSTAQNQICIWRYPALEMVASLAGHTSRVLYLAMSPDGETIVTGAGDETLRFWNAFPKREEGGRRESALDYGKLIR